MGASQSASAAGWDACAAPFLAPVKPATDPPPTDPTAYGVSADSAELVSGGVSTLRGDVHVVRGSELLTADELIYDEAGQQLNASGHVKYWEGGFHLSSDKADVDIDNDHIDANGANFLDEASHARGEAGRIQLFGSDLVKGEDVKYTTCMPAREDWSLVARNLDLDYVTDVGTARDVKVFFKDIPIFYSPYLTFPLSDKRKSGFLAPSARLSGPAGLEVLVPYYFNLAPNRDALVTTRLTTKRGAILIGEYRYLMPWGAGELDAEVVPDDGVRGGARGSIAFRHLGSFAPNWTLSLDYNQVTDGDYFNDLGNSLKLTSTTHLLRRAAVAYTAPEWTFNSRLETYQTVDSTIPGTSRPYKRLPQFLFTTTRAERNLTLNWNLYAEAVHFDRNDTVTGNRLDIAPHVNYPIRRSWGFFVPTLRARHTAYDLNNSTVGSNSLSRTTASFSADSGLYFERETTFGGQGYVQTIEPRLYYLVRPYVNQDDIPEFDTGEFTFNFGQLFRHDRFSGADRIGDAHQVSVALTSRLLSNNTGREVMRASIGQIRYLRDRRVQRAGQARQTSRSSPIVAEVTGSVGPWTLGAGTQWDTRESRSDKHTIAVRYRPGPDRVINAGYRFLRDTSEQADFSFRWPWNSKLDFVGRVSYALSDDRIVEAFGGFEYENCCWALRTVLRRFLRNGEAAYNNGIFLQLEFKGLAGIGNRPQIFLDRSIPGYRNDF